MTGSGGDAEDAPVKVEREFYFSKGISLPNLILFGVSTLVQVGVIISTISGYVADQNAAMAATNRRIERLEKQEAETNANARLIRLEERTEANEQRLADLRESIDRIEQKLDRLIERSVTK